MAFAMETYDTKVPAKARRRRSAAEYKRKILREAEHCRKPGEIGALLRRKGLYSSHLTAPGGPPERAALLEAVARAALRVGIATAVRSLRGSAPRDGADNA